MGSRPKLEFIFGCRSSISKYARDGAFVILSQRGCADIIGIEFMNGMDFIGHPKTYEEALTDYQRQIDKGWYPMDIADLCNTIIDNDEIDNDTILVPFQSRKT